MLTNLDLEGVRRDLPVTGRIAYLNTGTAGPLPQPAIDAMAAAARGEAEGGRIDHAGFERLFERLADLRTGVAALVGADPLEIGISHCTTDGMNIGTLGLDWKAGDRVVTTTLEHPGALLPLYVIHRRFGVEIEFADIGAGGREETLRAMEAAIRPGIKLVVLSHVTWGTGAVLPLAEISELARRVGALVLVDGAQSVGSIPVDMHASGADFYAFSGQKWLCGPEGTGGIYVRAESLERFHPAFVGGFGSDHDRYQPNDVEAWAPAAGAQRFEVGSVYRPGINALQASVEWRRALGEASFAAIRDLAGYCIERVGELPGVELLTPNQDELSGLVAFRLPGLDVTEAVEHLSAEGVAIRSIPDNQAMRISCGFYNTREEIDRALQLLGGLAGG
ncbi:MAG TPA: aminotransferase class V-fold PLP-dependent enzyme [Candidatus Dormibacteraeota bacterium]|nr:aminotransferase class V-fold PLP-dependent enzyme [Candidatus Dormibacteraeota bacterium]